MSEGRRYQDMSDEELEALLSSLPRRQPGPALRERILSQAPRHQARRAVLSRPAFALAALVLLLVGDLLVLRWQDRSVTVPGGCSAIATLAEVRPQEDEQVAWLREIGSSDLALIAALRPASGGTHETYFQLRTRLLAGNNGG